MGQVGLWNQEEKVLWHSLEDFLAEVIFKPLKAKGRAAPPSVQDPFDLLQPQPSLPCVLVIRSKSIPGEGGPKQSGRWPDE
jgi:hypothetical protein